MIHDSETPAHGQQVIVACALIHQKIDGVEHVFLAKRADTKKFYPGVYEIPGGHIDFGEDIIAGLQREVMEELGVEITVGDPFYAFSYLNEVKGAHSVEVVYFAQLTDTSVPPQLHPDDHSTADWFREDQMAIYSVGRTADDVESKVIARGFEVLRGEPLRF